MAQKAAKQTAKRNASVLNRTHMATVSIHTIFIFLRLVIGLHRRANLLIYAALSLPALLIEFWLERIGRPSYVPGSTELRRSGEDLEAKGLTEYMWDVLYWSWGCIVAATLFGDRAWWLWVVIPVYSLWLVYSTVGGMRSGLAGMSGQGDIGPEGTNGASNRQKKMEKRGGQKVAYR